MYISTPLSPTGDSPRQPALPNINIKSTSSYFLDYVLFLPGIWLVSALGVSLRLIGPAFIIIPVGFCFAYAILMAVKPPRILALYFVLCIAVAWLSRYQLLPNSWQVHFVPEAIVRQLVPLAGFFAVAWASKAYFRRRIMHGRVFSDASSIITLGVIVAPLIMYQQNVGYEGDRSLLAVIALLGSFINNMTIPFLFVMGAVFFTKDWRRRLAVTYVVLLAFTTHFLQFRILTIIMLAALCGFPTRRVVAGAIIGLVSAYVVGMNFIPEIMASDPNDGLRLQLVLDALRSAVDTNGIGIGYGKESVRWVYRYPGMPDFTFLPDAASMSPSRMLEALSTGVENSYGEALLRTGALGCILLLGSVLNVFPSAHLPRPVRNHAAMVFFLVFSACFVNSALESPISAAGIGFLYGYLLALRASARVCIPRITWEDRPAYGRSSHPT